MEAKLHIDLEQGTIEVEGGEEFVREIYRDFKDRISKSAPSVAKKTNGGQEAKKEVPPTHKPKAKQPKKEPLTIVKELDLAAKGDKPSLKDFYSGYNVRSNWERNLIFLYYLETIPKIASITTDHIFTCYRHVSAKIPKAFKQSLFDTASEKGWIDTSSLDDIKLTTQGMNYMEHDITKVG